ALDVGTPPGGTFDFRLLAVVAMLLKERAYLRPQFPGKRPGEKLRLVEPSLPPPAAAAGHPGDQIVLPLELLPCPRCHPDGKLLGIGLHPVEFKAQNRAANGFFIEKRRAAGIIPLDLPGYALPLGQVVAALLADHGSCV